MTYITLFNGSGWTGLGGSIDQFPNVMQVYQDALYVGGSFLNANSGALKVNNVARWDGQTWSSLLGGVSIVVGAPSYQDSSVTALAVYNNQLIVAGLFTHAGGVLVNHIASWDGQSWSTLNGGCTYNSPSQQAAVSTIGVFKNVLYVNGHFTTVGGSLLVQSIATWNGAFWASLGDGVTGSARVYFDSGGQLIVGGYYFTSPAGGSVNNIAVWNGTAWLTVGNGTPDSVYALGQNQSGLIAGGTFGVSYLDAVQAQWRSLGIISGVNALAMYGDQLYAAGDFLSAGAVSAEYIASWNGQVWAPLPGAPLNADVYGMLVAPCKPGWAESSNCSVCSVGFYGSNCLPCPINSYADAVASVTCAPCPAHSLTKTTAASAKTACVCMFGFFGPPGGPCAVDQGRLIVGGLHLSAAASAVVGNRITVWDGTAWTTFGGGVDNRVIALVVYKGELYAGGQFKAADGVATSHIARWNGGVWSAVGAGYSGTVNALAVGQNGTVLYAGGTGISRISQWNGTAWSSVGLGVDSIVYSLLVNGSDLYAAGAFATAGAVNASGIARWDGAAWFAVGDGTADGRVNVLTMYKGQLVAGGSFTNIGGVAAYYIAAWNGILWSSLNSLMDDDVLTLTADASVLYIGGLFITAGGLACMHIASWDGAQWRTLGSGTSGTVMSVFLFQNGLYAGGQFTTAGGVAANNIAFWDGAAWSNVGGGVDAAVSVVYSQCSSGWTGSDCSLCDYGYYLDANASGLCAPCPRNTFGAAAGSSVCTSCPDGTVTASTASVSPQQCVRTGILLYVGGTFTKAGTVGGTSYIAVWNGTTWQPMSSGLNANVKAMAVNGSNVFVGGYFTSVGGSSSNYTAQWNGTSWLPLDRGVNNYVRCLLMMSANVLFAGGAFTFAGDVPVNRIAKWDGSSWTALGPGMNSDVYVLAAYKGNLYAGGAFTTAGAVSAQFIAMWSGAVWIALGAGMDNPVAALAVFNASLFVGGAFSTANGISSPHLARWNGSAWTASSVTFGGNSIGVTVLAATSSTLHIGGEFTSVNDQYAVNLAKLDQNGVVTTFGTGLGPQETSECDAIAPYSDRVATGGVFQTAGRRYMSNLALWDESTMSAQYSPDLRVNGYVYAMATTCSSSQVTGVQCDQCAQPSTFGANCTPCTQCIRGTCVEGFAGNCSCASGWVGTGCDTCAADFFGANCTACTTCSLHGTCIDGLQGNCTCTAGWTGATCNTCATGYFGANCTACSACANGTCTDGLAGNCSCIDGFGGPLCADLILPTAGPTTASPTTVAPTTAAPTTLVPTTVAPTTSVPTTEAPTAAAPTTGSPTTPAPTTGSPTTPAPTTGSPTTPAPTTASPSTPVPPTPAPTTVAPTTTGPTTAAPTIDPTTVPPTTPASTTETPTTPAPTTPSPTTVAPTNVSATAVNPTSSPPVFDTPTTGGLSNGAIIGIAVGSVVLVVVIAVVAVVLWRRRVRPPPEYEMMPPLGASEVTLDPTIVLHLGEALGKGFYSDVFRATYGSLGTVAAKQLHGNGTPRQLKQAMNEVRVTKALALHVNVLHVFGVYIGPPTYIVSELCNLGSLHEYVSKNAVDISLLCMFCVHIARGMKHLHGAPKLVLHRDLAARNVLITHHGESLVAKVADFGMSRIVDADYYRRQHSGLPIRWTAPEVFGKDVFTCASDVWSFGVTIWEIYSKGRTPYDGFANEAVEADVAKGNATLTQPDSCPPEVWKHVFKCLLHNPEARPTFETLATDLQAAYVALGYEQSLLPVIAQVRIEAV